MKIIGITGKSGSGKTTVATILSKKIECNHIDIDKVGHQALIQPEIINNLVDKFGKEILDNNGKVDRKKMGNIVFANEQKMKELTDITWNYMEETIDDILLKKENAIILDWILLPQSKYWNKCDYKILVKTEDTKRKDKVIQRDNISEEYFDKRDSASIDYTPYKFDCIIENDYKLQTINEIIEKIIKIM